MDFFSWLNPNILQHIDSVKNWKNMMKLQNGEKNIVLAYSPNLGSECRYFHKNFGSFCCKNVYGQTKWVKAKYCLAIANLRISLIIYICIYLFYV